MNVFELAAKIAVDASEFKKGLNTSEKSISDFANKATKTLNTLKKVFIGVVSVATVKKIASGIFDLANATSQLGDRVDKQSQALGMSRKGFQEWDYILSQSGASIDSMGASMRTLNQAILSGNAESVNALKELGLSVESLSSMSQEQAFEATVKALQQLPPGAQKSALAMKLLGRGAQSLMPLLNSSAESVDALKKRAQELGLVMSDEAVDASVAFGDALDDLKRTMTAIKNTVGATFLPALTNGLIAVTNYAGKFRGYVQNAIETGDWKGLFKNIGGDVAEAARLLWIRITDTVPILWENAQQALLGSDSPILQAIGSLMQDISDSVKYISDHKQDFIDTFNEITGAIGSVVTTGIETVKSVFEWLNEHGINAFVLKYRVANISAYVLGYRILGLGNKYPNMLMDVEQALQFVYTHADSLHIDTTRIGVMGFSAGGHLAMMSATHNRTSYKPAFVCSVYPVVTMSDKRTAQHIPHSYLQFRTGGHGFGVSDTKGTEESKQWKKECLQWISNLNQANVSKSSKRNYCENK